MVEAAYRSGNLLQLADGSVCEVEEMGLRSSRMYSLDSHCTLFMPNKNLANLTIINITKPYRGAALSNRAGAFRRKHDARSGE